MRNSILLLEVIFSIVLFSIIMVYSMSITLNLFKNHKISTKTTYENLLLETTRLYLSKNNNLILIEYKNTVLYYDNNILLKNVSLFNISSLNNILDIDICISNNSNCQNWKIKIDV